MFKKILGWLGKGLIKVIKENPEVIDIIADIAKRKGKQ